MKNSIIIAAALCCSLTVSAQGQRPPQPKMPNFIFTTVDSIAITPVKNQSNAGTCWAYSGIGFLESEILRTKKKAYDLSEMYVAFNTYMDRAEKAVRTSGDVSFGQGGDFGDILVTMEQYGMVPDSEMPAGAMYGKELSNHSELSALTNPMVDAIAKGRLRNGMQVSPDGEQLYKKALRAVHEVYLGKCPEKFTFEGKEYTPLSFAKTLGINPKDYVSLTSFAHHPYGETFALEVPDNYYQDRFLNLDPDTLMAHIDHALQTGHPVCWEGDISEDGFNWPMGIARLERAAERSILNGTPLKNARQQDFEEGKTTDDHSMELIGIARSPRGRRYYIAKNSWGTENAYKGLMYLSENYIRLKTIAVWMSQDAFSM